MKWNKSMPIGSEDISEPYNTSLNGRDTLKVTTPGKMPIKSICPTSSNSTTRETPLHKIKGHRTQLSTLQFKAPSYLHLSTSLHSSPTIICASTASLLWKEDCEDIPRLAWHPLLPSSPHTLALLALQDHTSLPLLYAMLTTPLLISQTSTTSNDNSLYAPHPIASTPFKCLQTPCLTCPMNRPCHYHSDMPGPPLCQSCHPDQW
jgi:hypothetical protein